jgi:Cu2+-exporting ATPase
MEQQSEHPFANALRDAATALTKVSLEQRFNHLGKGIEATLKGKQWKLGSESFAGGEPLLQDQQRLNTLRDQGFSLLYLSNTLGLQAIFCIHDPLREGIEAFLADLSADKHCVILSGDHPQSVTAMASSLGITESYGGMSPEDKLQWIKQRQQQGHVILMLGDGINDAPTLAAANVSLAFNDATDLAQSQCDLMILRKDYKHLASAFSLMKKTRTIILQNLGWAIAYNLLAIPAAAMGLVTPWMAAIGMSLSSFVVVLNSLRLRKMNY